MASAETVENFARFDDARVDDAVVDVETTATCMYDTVVSHEGEVLREICFGKFGDFEEIFDTSLMEFQNIENFQSF